MHTQIPVLLLIALALPMAAQKATPVVTKTGPSRHVAAGDQPERQKLHENAMKFLESADARQRLRQTLDKLLEDGKQAMMSKNPGLDPAFGEEWIKRMRQRVSVDQFVAATAEVYEKYFTKEELNELTQGQLALKKGQLYSLPPQLGEKLKTNSPLIQRDINASTSLVGARLGAEVGKEIEREHTEWIKPVALGASAREKKS